MFGDFKNNIGNPQGTAGDQQVTSPADLFNESHKLADVDKDRDAMHHTLGSGPNQAATGNHGHIGTVITIDLTLPSNYLALDGTVINQVDYPEYFAFMGTSLSTYTLPNIAKLAVRVK